jgi:acetyl esterase/lipase
MSRFGLRIKVFILRKIESIFTFLDLHFSHPLPHPVSFTRTIPSSVGLLPGKIKILFYTPPSYKSKSLSKSLAKPPSPPSTEKHPLVINFHGGGFTIGHTKDDARWATAVTENASAVIASVNYRLAPEHPFPIGIEDCVSAVLWLWQHAEELNFDTSRTIFSGFSAGGNFAYAVSIRLHEELEKLKAGRRLEAVEVGKVVGLVVFYASVDWTQTRAERDASNPNLIPVIPPTIFKIFEDSYIAPKQDMSSPLLSPGKAPDHVLRDALPDQLVMINCGGDQLLAENLKFRTRLQRLGKRVDECKVVGVGHGWDKQPSFKKGNIKRDEAYGVAVESLKTFFK